MADDVQADISLNIDTSKALSGLKALQSQLSALHTQLSSLGPAQRSSAGAIQRQLVDNINATGKFAASMTTVKTTAESFTTALEKNKLTMGEYFRYAGGASKSFGKNFAREFATIEKVAVERVKTLQTQYVKLGRDANGAMKAIAVRPLTLDMDNLQTKTAIAAQKQLLLNQLLKQGSTQMLNWGKNTQWAGRQLMVGFTIPLGIFAGQAMKAFSDMEKQIISFKRVYGDLSTSAKDTDAMAESIKNLATEFTKYGLAVSDTMEMASKAAAMGKTGADLLGQVQQASKLAVLGQVEQQQALQTTISLTDTFGTAAVDLGKKINFLNAVENQTAVSIEDLTIAIPKAGPVIKQLGGDVEDLAFFLTAMREGGINASEGANALKSGLAAMINPTGKAAEMLEGFGINLQKIVKTNKGDVRGTVVEFAKALDTLDPLNRAKAIEQLFGKFQFARISTLMKNVVSDSSQAATTAQLAQKSSVELATLAARELRQLSSSPLYKFQKALQDFQTQLAPIGEAFMKFVTPIIDWVNGILKAFNGLSEGTKTFFVGFMSVVAGLGPVLLMTFGLIANGFANLIKGFTALKSMFNKVQTSSEILGQETSYMTQEQMKAKAVAASLDQVHGKLIQTFNVEAGSVNKLAAAYERAILASQRLVPVSTGAGKGGAKAPKKFAQGGVIKGPGTGTSDSISAMVSNGEAIIPAKSVSMNRPLVESLISGNVPKFAKGGIIGRMFVGMPKSFKAKTKEREAANQISQSFMSSSKFRDQDPEDYMGQVSPTSGHSFPIFGLGGVYRKRNGEKVFVKPVMDDVGALGELRATIIARQAHGLVTPQQRIVVMKDPTDRRGQRRFLALESPLDPRLSSPTGKFTKKEYFKQLLASTLRGDKDLSPDNVYGNVLPDVGTAGVFNRASGLRAYESNMPSIEEQATINLLGVKGGAKKAFAQSTADLIRSMKPEDYARAMKEEIEDVLPKLRQTIGSLGLDSVERPYYDAMIKRLEDARGIDWTRFHDMHSKVPAPLPTQAGKNVAGFAEGGIIRGPGTGTSDSIIARVSNKEAIIPAKSVAKFPELVNALIDGKIPGFARGKRSMEDKDSIIRLYQSKSRSAPKQGGALSFSNQAKNMSWKNFGAEEAAAANAALEFLISTGMDPETAKKTVDMKYRGMDLAHTNPKYQDRTIAGKTFKEKLWTAGAGDTTPDLRAFNQFFADRIEKTKGKKYASGSYIGDVLRDKSKVAEIAKSSGLTEAEALKELKKFEAGQYPKPGDKKALQALGGFAAGEKTAGGAATSAGIKERLKSFGKAGSYDQAAKSGAFVFDKKAEELAKKEFDARAKDYESKIRALESGEKVTQSTQESREKVKKQVDKQLVSEEKITRSVKESEKEYLSRARQERDMGKRLTTKQKRVLEAYDTQRTTIAAKGRATRERNAANRQSQSYLVSGVDQYIVDGDGSAPSTRGRRRERTPRPARTPGRLSRIAPFLGLGRDARDRRAASAGNLVTGRVGAGMGLGMVGSIAGQMIGGETGNNISMGAFAAGGAMDLVQMFPKLATGIARFIPHIAVASAAIAGMSLIVDAATKEERDRVEKQKSLNSAMDAATGSAKSVADFFGRPEKDRGYFQKTSEDVAGGTAQAIAVDEYKKTDGFRADYGPMIENLKGKSKEEVEPILQALAIKLGPDYAKEEVEVVLEAIRQEAGLTDVNLEFKTLDFSSKEGAKESIKTIQTYVEDLASTTVGDLGKINFSQSTGQWSLSEEQKEKIQRYAAGMKQSMESLRAAFDDGKISADQYSNAIQQIGENLNSMSDVVADRTLMELGELVLKSTDDKLLVGSIKNRTTQYKVLTAAIKNYGKAMAYAAQIQAIQTRMNNFERLAMPTLGQISQYNLDLKSLKAINKELDKINKSTTTTTTADDSPYNTDKETLSKKQQARQKQAQDGLTYLGLLEEGINKKYDDRLEALDKVAQLNKEIAASQRDQLDLADALSRGDIAAAARAAQTMRSNETQREFDRQREAIEAARNTEVDSLKVKIDGVWYTRAQLEAKDASYNMKAALNAIRNNTVSFAGGGKISGPGTGTSDDIPAMLSNGEYVIRAKAVKHLGVDTLDKLNHAEKFGVGGFARKYANGGIINRYAVGGPVVPRNALMADAADEKRQKIVNTKKYKSQVFEKPAKAFDLFDSETGYGSQSWANTQLGVAEGQQIANSYGNVFSGKGNFWDWLTAITAPLALTGFGKAGTAVSSAGKLVRPSASTIRKEQIAIAKADDKILSDHIKSIRSNPQAYGLTPETYQDAVSGVDKFRRDLYRSTKNSVGPQLDFTPGVLNEPEFVTAANSLPKLTDLSTSDIAKVGKSYTDINSNAFPTRSGISPFMIRSSNTRTSITHSNKILDSLLNLGIKTPAVKLLEKNLWKNPEVYTPGVGPNPTVTISDSSKTGASYVTPTNPIYTADGSLLDGYFKPEGLSSMFSRVVQPYGGIAGYFTKGDLKRTDTLLLPHEWQHLRDGTWSNAISNANVPEINRFGVTGQTHGHIEARGRVAESLLFEKPVGLYNFMIGGKNDGTLKSMLESAPSESFDTVKSFLGFGGRAHQLNRTFNDDYKKTVEGFSEIFKKPIHTKNDMAALENFVGPRGQVRDSFKFDRIQNMVDTLVAEGLTMADPAMRNLWRARGNIVKSLEKKMTPAEVVAKWKRDLGFKVANIKNKFRVAQGKSYKPTAQPVPPMLDGFANGGMVNRYANGGMVSKIKPSYFNAGGLAKGTDTIPAMLTPGEFVMTRSAVQNFGVDNLKSINSGDVKVAPVGDTSSSESVYNYSVNVNVSTNANANEIAKTVMTQIKRIDSQRVRGV